MSFLSSKKVTAVLGPTNTGKTYLAIERMLSYGSGMIGFPLRLLARENYDRAVAIRGKAKCALVTGEEKIVPPGARYFFCTVESMPVDRLVEFLAVDEIQLCADEERGHIFTDRLLHARGTAETMFMGADTIKPVLRHLLKDVEFVERPRFSRLSYAGSKKIVRLPPRSAVVAFSAADVYQIAEMMRAHRGGTAVVLGALSPRTRNAQVELFENGDVDYLVATDAIGMGLNLNVDHVAFARLGKFDGRIPRRLTASEVGQIAGRAGRHTRDGTFGTTNEVGGLSEDLIDRVENHEYDPIKAIYWRNRNLDLRSPQALLRSLEARTEDPRLLRVRDGEDHQALVALSQESAILDMAKSRQAVSLLWEVCQIPDFQKILTDQHIRLLSRIYHYLMSDRGTLPEDWVASQIHRIDRTDGDIDTLVSRIAHIRTWTYISHRSDWLADGEHWQGVARAIEDRLSDALHERLTQRFVDRRAATLVRSLRAGEKMVAAVKANGEVVVEGELLGKIEGFNFVLDSSLQGTDVKPALTAARKTLLGEMPARVTMFEQDNDGSFLLSDNGELTWRGVPVARLAKGESALSPAIDVFASEFLDGPQRERLRLRLQAWLERHLRAQLKPLFFLAAAELDGAARGLGFQVVEALGLIPRREVHQQISALSKNDRKALSNVGLRLGRESVFLPNLNRPRACRLRALLWAAANEAGPVALPDFEAASFEPSEEQTDAFCSAIGYRRLSDRKGRELALRSDIIERLSHEAYKLLRQGKDADEAKGGKVEETKVEEAKQPEEKPAEATPQVADAEPSAEAESAEVATEVAAVAEPTEDAVEAKPETEAAAEEAQPAETQSTETQTAAAQSTEVEAPQNDQPELPAGSFAISEEMRKAAAGMDDQQIAFVLKNLRFQPTRLKGGVMAFSLRAPRKPDPRKKEAHRKKKAAEKARMSDSPFAVLQGMSFNR